MRENCMRSPQSQVYVRLVCHCPPCMHGNGRPNLERMGILLSSATMASNAIDFLFLDLLLNAGL